MSDHIKKEDAIREIDKFKGYLDDDMLCRIKIALNRIPTADVVEVVRCKYCVYFHTTASGVSYCTNQDMMPFADDYCCNGRRKDEKK